MGKIEIIELDSYFVGIGEVKGRIFNQISSTASAYLYEINTGGTKYYEVFKRRSNAILLNFEKREYSKHIFKERYPKSNDFGVWAWTFTDLKVATEKLESIGSEVFNG